MPIQPPVVESTSEQSMQKLREEATELTHFRINNSTKKKKKTMLMKTLSMIKKKYRIELHVQQNQEKGFRCRSYGRS